MNTTIESNTGKYITEGKDDAISYKTYVDLMQHLVDNEATTGDEQTESNINYTKLNQRRMKRWDKTVKISDAASSKIIDSKKKLTWLVISESWCGDAAHVLPVMNKVAELNDGIDLRIVMRDEHPELMGAFLTNGSRSIPKLIVIDVEANKVVNSYGPRPNELTRLVNEFKATHGKLTAEFKEDIQRWYNKDKGQHIIEDLITLL